MLYYVWTSCLIQLSHLLLRQPNSITCKLNLYTGFAIFALIYYYPIIVVHLVCLIYKVKHFW